MFKELKHTCTPIVLLIKSFVEGVLVIGGRAPSDFGRGVAVGDLLTRKNYAILECVSKSGCKHTQIKLHEKQKLSQVPQLIKLP